MKMQAKRGRVFPLLAAILLLCSCGKEPGDSNPLADSQTEFPASTAAAETEPAVQTAAESSLLDGGLDAYLWEAYDLAFSYPSAYTITPTESESDSEMLSAETGNTADGMVRIAVSETCYPTSAFEEITAFGVCRMTGLSMMLMNDGTICDVTLPHLSGLEAQARKFTVSCQYDETPATLTILLVNCFATDHLYTLACASTNGAYESYCENLEDYFYLGNCSVSGNTIHQEQQPVSQQPTPVDLGYGCTFSLPAEWREYKDPDSDTSESSADSLEFQNAAGDYLLLSAQDGMTDSAFETLMAQQTIGSGAGGLTVTGKEARTVMGYPAYLIHETRPSWGLSQAETVPVLTWYIHRNDASGVFLILSMIDVSGTQTDFIQHPENYWIFS